MKIVTYDGTELELSPVELSMLVDLGLANVEIDLTDAVTIDEEDADLDGLFNNCDCESCDPEAYSYCEEEGIKARPSMIERALDRTPEPVDRFEDAKVEVVDRYGSLVLMINEWAIISIDKETGKLRRHVCADLSGIEADEEGRIIMDEE